MTDSELLLIVEVVGGLFAIGAGTWNVWLSSRLKKNELDHQAKLDSQIEEFKARIEHQRDVAVERLRADLTIATMEREVIFRRLHETRAEKIAQIYSQLSDVRMGVVSCVHDRPNWGPDAPEDLVWPSDVTKIVKAARETLAPARIYLPRKTVADVERFLRDVQQKVNRLGASRGGVDVWEELLSWVDTESQTMMDMLEVGFRELLGHSELESHSRGPVSTSSPRPRSTRETHEHS